jgi:Holliday junction resolvasome RuvABC ATP-dependent DNA helicase subunit
MYCESKNSATFFEQDWDDLRNTLGIKPLGLTNIEHQVLQILSERGPSTLQTIAAVTGMSRTAIQKEAELYLLQRGLMKINGTREITRLGTEILKELEDKTNG